VSIGASEIAGVITATEAMFPLAVLTMYWGTGGADGPRDHTAQVLRSESTESNSEGDLSGAIEGLRGRLRLILSRCGDWAPPADGSVIELYDADDELIGTFTVIGHNDDPTKSVRTLIYGEEAA